MSFLWRHSFEYQLFKFGFGNGSSGWGNFFFNWIPNYWHKFLLLSFFVLLLLHGFTQQSGNTPGVFGRTFDFIFSFLAIFSNFFSFLIYRMNNVVIERFRIMKVETFWLPLFAEKSFLFVLIHLWLPESNFHRALPCHIFLMWKIFSFLVVAHLTATQKEIFKRLLFFFSWSKV